MPDARMPEVGADLSLLARRAVERALERTRAVSVGRVVSFAAGSATAHATCSVQPLTPRFRDSGDAIFDPVLDDVPVLFPGSRGFRVDWRLADGDLVLLLFGDHALDDVIEQLHGAGAQNPQAADPQHARMHDVSDALAIPVAVYAGGAGQVDLLDWARTLITTLQAATVTTMLGQQPLDPATQAALVVLLAELDGVR